MKTIFSSVLLSLATLIISQSALGAPPYPYGPAARPWSSSSYSMFVERGMSEIGYIVKIHIRGFEPSEIQVTPQPGHLLIQSSRQQSSSTRRDDIGYRGFSVSSSRFMQRVPLPRDADFSRMQRTDAPDVVTIVIPRRTPGAGFRRMW
ncbi:MAG TPA: Hsp20/alpha crystallin family protein [Chromatiales bacterium]|nr:Hsp20/alpha crystallin family protein [Chromatiales bacterium]